MNFSERIKINPSATMAINALVQQKRLKGQKVYNLSIGEPMIDTDPVIIESAYEAMKKGETHYPPVQGLNKLLSLASEWMNERYGSSYDNSNTIVTTGGKYGISLVLQALLNDGDEIIIHSPYWVSYPEMVRLFGGTPVIVKTGADNGWKVKLEDLHRAITNKTKIIIINNASNPTGVMYSKEEMREILKLAQENGVMVLSDEVYSGLVYDSQEYVSAASFPEYRDNVIIIESCSKNFAMTGWRVGFVFAPLELIKSLNMLQGQSTSGAAIMCQWGAVTALENRHRICSDIRRIMKNRRDVFIENFNRIFNEKLMIPSAGLYVFLPISIFSNNSNSISFCRDLLEKNNLAAVPGESFGEMEFVRFSFGSPESELIEALEVLAKYKG